ncbi:THP3 (YPR045C) [Zygosaccharomyces parabailii]|nr:THP3 (YPR045C) [Zygosaccharomyces parabailii]
MSGAYNKVTPLTLGQNRKANHQPIDANLSSGVHTFPSSKTPPTFQGSWNPFPGYNTNTFYGGLIHSGSNTLLRPNGSGTLDEISHPLPAPSKNPQLWNNYDVSLGNNRKRPRKADISSEEAERRRKRAERFGTEKKGGITPNLDEEENFSNLNAISTKSHKFDKNKRIVGYCQDLEKPYLRLTSEPNPSLVRPLSVLKKTYNMLMNKYDKKQATYQYLCDQFKSVRQDLRVQIIENQFTIKVYQSHARIALENGDIGEFNQCQSRLIALFELPNIKTSCFEEFTSYRILYYILTEDYGAINDLRLKLMTECASVFNNRWVHTAFQLARAKLVGDYHQFMKLYHSMEDLGKKLAELFIEKEKLKSLATICRSYNQIPLEFFKQEFQFGSVDVAMDFLSKRGLSRYIIIRNQGQKNEYRYLDTKACRPHVLRQYSEAKKIDIKGQQ